MKRIISLICTLALLFSFVSCGERAGSGEGTTAAPPEENTVALRVVDGAGTDQLILAGKESGEVYTVNAKELTLSANGKTAETASLENGMLLALEADFTTLETWPAQSTGASAKIRNAGKEDRGDLCGLYLQVLEDLWKEDGALNADITYISVDLKDAPGGLTDGEKAAVAWLFAGRHGAQELRYGFEELAQNGYVDKDELYWKDGVLLSIKKTENGTENASKITFDAEKWRSGTGAIFFNGCTAKRGDGVRWEPYRPGAFAIA